MNVLSTTDPRSTTEKEAIRMLLPEEMARIRKQELLTEAHRARLVRRATAGRWWARLARCAQRKADRAREEVSRS